MARKQSVFRRRPDLLRTLGPMQVALWYTGQEPDGFHREIYSYRMWDLEWDPETHLFQGEGFMPGAGHEESEVKVLDLLDFLTLSEGDTDDEYFKDYTKRQLKWRDERAADLNLEVQVKEEEIQEAYDATGKIPVIFRKQDWSPRDYK